MKKNKKSIITEFKEFIMRGNVIDMAIGVIIAGAFSKITGSLVNDMFMPFLGFLIGDIDLTQLNIELVPAVVDAAGEITTPAVVLGIGTFISTIIDFLLIALIIFTMVKVFAKTREIAEKNLRKKQVEEEVSEPEVKVPTTEELLTDILTELKKQNEK